MPWWTNALYDTCSLITPDKILLDHPEIEAHVQPILSIEPCFQADQLRQETAARMQSRVDYLDMPDVPELTRILATAQLSKAIAQVDTFIYATAVHYQYTVITGDKRLAQALVRECLRVGNVALMLKTLVSNQVVSETACNAILADLVTRHDFILPPNRLQTWATLRRYTFP